MVDISSLFEIFELDLPDKEERVDFGPFDDLDSEI